MVFFGSLSLPSGSVLSVHWPDSVYMWSYSAELFSNDTLPKLLNSIIVTGNYIFKKLISF